MPRSYPFAAIVGQDEMKLALFISAIDPSVGGVMVFGDRGTGKSTAVRALASLLPPMEKIQGCRFNCDPRAPSPGCIDCGSRKQKVKTETIPVPVVDLPLGATEDRVVGALDLEKALARGQRSFEPGLLAQAHRGFLYIDEINLLEDHLVDLLLDVAASGENIVEREGLSVRHPARFVLVGSGNPEEGELRPQLLDRFGLSVDVKTPSALADRVEILKRRDAFERDADGFDKGWEKKSHQAGAEIAAARRRIAGIKAADEMLELMSKLCIALGADGLRGELTLLRAARAVAALEGAKAVTRAHIRSVAPMALRHRLRRNPLDESGSGARVERALADVLA